MKYRLQAAAVWLCRWLIETFDLRELLVLGGLAAVFYGLAQVYQPAAWCVCGSAIFWLGVSR